jgi:plastocyanin
MCAALAALLLVAGTAAAACNDGDSDDGGLTQTPISDATPDPLTPTVEPGGEAGEIVIEAEETAFNVDTLVANAGDVVTIRFVNHDAIPHSLAIYAGEVGGEEIFQIDEITGPEAEESMEFQVPDEPGEYPFHCEVHPERMTGTLTVQ